MPAWIQALIWLSGRDLQRETIKIMVEAKYVDGYRRLHPAEKGPTFPTWDPHLRMDYAFLPESFANRLLSCEVINQPKALLASDHFPLLAQVDFS